MHSLAYMRRVDQLESFNKLHHLATQLMMLDPECHIHIHYRLSNKEAGSNVIIEDINFRVDYGHKYGYVSLGAAKASVGRLLMAYLNNRVPRFPRQINLR